MKNSTLVIFLFLKTMQNFSSLAPDQVREQINDKIKGLGGVIYLTDLIQLAMRNGELLVQNLHVC